MGLQAVPAYIAQTGFNHPATLDRNILEGLFQRSGGIRFGDFALSVGTGVRGVAIAPGRYFILGLENAQQGGYFAWSDGIDNVNLAAAVGNPRIDTILLRVYDDQYGVITGVPRAQIDVVQGVAAGAPVARVDADFTVGGGFYVPGGWARLGDVRVNVADTGALPAGQITTRNRYVRVPGGRVPCLSTDRPSDPVVGDEIWETDTTISRMWDGSAWTMDRPWKLLSTVGVATAVHSIQSIPSGLRKLMVVWDSRSSTAAVAANMFMRVNNVSTASYTWTIKQTNNITRSAPVNTGAADTGMRVGVVAGATATANNQGHGVIDISMWDNSWLHQTHQNHFWESQVNSWIQEGSGQYATAGAYNRLDFYMDAGNVAAGSRFHLEGWE